jgi:hypothetical protein
MPLSLCRPGVGHNCMFDIAYTMAQFVEPSLPLSWDNYKRLVSHVRSAVHFISI